MGSTEILLAIGVVAGILVLIFFVLPLLSVLGPHCRCGHHRSVHYGQNTECAGWWSAEPNALGHRQVKMCNCQSYRLSERGYWDRLFDGTEERPRG